MGMGWSMRAGCALTPIIREQIRLRGRKGGGCRVQGRGEAVLVMCVCAGALWVMWFLRDLLLTYIILAARMTEKLAML